MDASRNTPTIHLPSEIPRATALNAAGLELAVPVEAHGRRPRLGRVSHVVEGGGAGGHPPAPDNPDHSQGILKARWVSLDLHLVPPQGVFW